ncbi:GntR family transcriptional regulator [Marinobacterium sedimentorum]|uniref:GntR family transcriptional regulator n=1 Tax=Marinobacterium sedimentorum TaxID=2927804 RepID=UPI0020C70A0C|nr:GntR family transcriptional regulator [Marinobacterium sedimentorum]MCP8688083.1 GntR family transcriptional regulator [Marinobacterium sedimentorum]
MNQSVRLTHSVRRRLLHEDVAEHLRTMITEETLAEGSRVDEVELCALLDISRTPLREALKVLQSEGLISIEPHKGARVTAMSEADLGELFDVLSGLERLAAELAAQRASDEELEAFRALNDEMETQYRARDPRAYFALNLQVHQRVIDLSGNRQLKRVHSLLSGRTRRGRYSSTLSDAHWDESVQEHNALVQALLARDGKQAGRILFDHVIKTGDTILDMMQHQKIAQA